MQASNEPGTICGIFHESRKSMNQTGEITVCLQKFELSTFISVYEIASVYAVCYGLMSVLINRAGKLSLLLVITITTGLAALLLMFVNVPWTLSYLYLYMILSGLAISVINASTAELFPTKMRFGIYFRFGNSFKTGLSRQGDGNLHLYDDWKAGEHGWIGGYRVFHRQILHMDIPDAGGSIVHQRISVMHDSRHFEKTDIGDLL